MTIRAILLAIILVLIFVLLTGCATVPSPTQTVKVAVPITCKAAMPDRPVMPTEYLESSASLDEVVQSLTAEIELREGYEDKLRTALLSCR